MTAPLRRLDLQTNNRSARHFVAGWRDEDAFDFETPYQRGHVWGIDQKVALIRSMLLGLPIGNVVVNFPGNYPAKGPVYRVIDGKQRITAIREFVEDGFAVPAEWFDKADRVTDAATIRFSELSRPAQRSFEMSTVPEVVSSVKTVAEEAEIFRLLNSGGTPQTDADLARAAAVEAAG
jgi:hypothetical protein